MKDRAIAGKDWRDKGDNRNDVGYGRTCSTVHPPRTSVRNLSKIPDWWLQLCSIRMLIQYVLIYNYLL